MIDEKYIDLITAYLNDTITSEERARLNQFIDEGEIDILDVKALESTYEKLGRLPSPDPSEQMRESFYTMLTSEKEKQVSTQNIYILSQIRELFTSRRIAHFAVAIGFFLIGIVAGNFFTPFQNYRQQLNQLSQEVSQMRQVMMLSLLDAQSSSERLKAVNISADMTSADERVITALLKTLNNDPNVNVRLASIEALLRHAGNPKVRQGLVEAISSQQSPQIQVALADAMLALQEKESVDQLRRLLEQNELNSTVRSKLKNTIAALI